MFKRLCSTLICFTFIFLSLSCQAKQGELPPHAYVSVEESPETFKKNNEDIKQYWSFDDNLLNIGSLGVTFYKLSFPSSNYATVTFTYPDVPSLTIENVSSTSGYFDHDRPDEGISSSRVTFFIENVQGSYGVTKKDAYIAIQKLFKQLEEQGWQDDHRIDDPRISIQDSYTYGTSENVGDDFVNYQYPLTFDQFKNLPSLQTWSLRHGTDVLLDIRMQYNFEEEINNYVYMVSLDFSSQEIHINSCSDITYIWTAEGWLYLAGVKDLCTKELVGYATSERMTADLVCRALNMAIKNKRPSQGLIVHSDRGSQYCSHAYHKIIKQHQFTGSMSGKGNHYEHSPPPCTRVSVSQTLTYPRSFDNAPIESFWGVLKNELVYHQDYKTRFTAINDIIGYIELYYNQTRIQKDLGFKSPRQVWFDFYRQAA